MSRASVVDMVGEGKNANEINLILAQAYRDFFRGSATKAQAEIVTTDLAAFTGFYEVTAPPQGTDRLWFDTGKRAVMHRILSFATISEREEMSLRNAAREQTTVAEQQEQDLLTLN